MSKDHCKQRSRAILIALFFTSGFTGLTYEILWQKQFIVHLGAAAPSVAAVLAAFFAGIAFGGEFGDVLLLRSRKPALALYAGAEFVIASNAFLMPWIQSGLFALYISTARHADPTGVAMYAFRFVLCCVGVLPATLAMGATIPLMAAALKNENGVARAYGVNAAGGMTGALLTTFGLVPILGIRGATLATLGVNVAVITVALFLARKIENRDLEALPPPPEKWIAVYFASAAIALGAEMTWIRVAGLLTTNGAGLFALTLSVFLAAYTVGSLVLHPQMAKKFSPRQEAAWLQILAATAILISIPLARHAPALLEHWVREPIANGLSHPWAVVAYELYCVLVLVALPASAMGAIFPAIARETKAVGTLYFWGNLGSLFGSALFSLVLIPVSGLTSSLLWLAIANVVLALRSDFESKRVRLAGMLVAAICAVLWTRFPPFIKGDFEQKLSSDGYWEEWRGPQQAARLLRYKEGTSATIAIRESGQVGHPDSIKRVYVDEQLVASTDPEAIVDSKMLAHLPALLHPAPRKALSVGYGSGGTSWSLVQYSGLEAQTVEIEQEILNSAPLFRYGAVWRNPNFSAIHDDARDHLATTGERYDFISTDVTNLQYKQNPNLYTVEYFQLMRDRLTEDGIACAWIPMSAISPDELKTLLRTFQEVYLHASLWLMNEQPTYFGILIGTKNALKIDLARVRDRMSNTAVKEDLSLIGIEHPLQIPSFLLLDEEGIRRYASGSRLHTDDDPVLEHHSMLSYYFYLQYFTENLRDTLALRPVAAAPFIVSHDKSEAEEAERVWRASALWYQALLHQSETAIEKDGRARLAAAIAAREAASQALRVHPGWTSSQRWFKAIEQIVIHIKSN